MGSEKMDPFDVLNMGNISNFHLDHSNCYFFLQIIPFPCDARACQILVKIHFSWKLIMGSEKMDPFYVLNMGNISNFHLDHSNRYLFLLFKFQDPFISPKKNSSDYRVYGSQNDGLEPRVSTQKSVLQNMHRVPRYWQKCIQI